MEQHLHKLPDMPLVSGHSRLQTAENKANLTSFQPSYEVFRSFLRRRLPDDDTADDLLQQNLLKAFEQDAWNETENSKAWFYRVLHNAVADYYRARAVRFRREERFSATEVRTTSPEEDAEEDACRCFQALLPGLKSEYAETLRLVDLEGLSPREAAAKVGISIGNLNVRLHRARAGLRERLTATCGNCSQHGCLNCTCAS